MPQSIVLLISISGAIFLLVLFNILLALFGHGHFIYELVGYGFKCLENWSTCPLLTSEIWSELVKYLINPLLIPFGLFAVWLNPSTYMPKPILRHPFDLYGPYGPYG